MTARTLPVALAHWMSTRLIETLDRPLERSRTYALTVVDPADHDPATMQVRAGLVDGQDGSRVDARERPDALAAASRLWLPPGAGIGGPVHGSRRPQEFVRRRRALGVAVVADDGVGVVLRFEDDPDTVSVVDPRRAAGLLLPLVRHWRSFDVATG